MDHALPQAMLLDLDDTILSYSAHAEPCWLSACAMHGDRLGEITVDTLYRAVQDARKWFWSDPVRHRQNRQDMRGAHRKVVSRALRGLGQEDSELATSIADAFGEERQKGVKPFPGALETLSALQEQGVRMALVTNGGTEPQREKIDAFGLEPYFRAVLIEGELGFGKPDARVYRQALELLSADPPNAWIVGDNLEWEVAVPQGLGLYAVWHDPTGQGLPPGSTIRPDRIIYSLPELLHQDTRHTL